MQKVGKTTRPFRYDLNQIPYGYTVEVTNRFKVFNLLQKVPEELRTEICNTVQEAVIQNFPRKRNAKRQNGCLRRPYKHTRKEEEAKRKIYAIECRVPENSKER